MDAHWEGTAVPVGSTHSFHWLKKPAWPEVAPERLFPFNKLGASDLFLLYRTSSEPGALQMCNNYNT